MTDFKSLGLSEQLLKAVTESGYDTPTPIQRDAIPLIIQGQDLIGLAQTGTGKTAAFGLPLAQRLIADPKEIGAKEVRALILAPTRELVNQITKNLVTFVRGTPLRVAPVVGGVSINPQIKRLSRGTDILVATPGRLLDLVDRGAVNLGRVTFLVLDEADQMLDLGFIHALRKLKKLVSPKRQTLLFSATMPKLIEELAQTYLSDPVRVEVARAGKTADKVEQCVHFMEAGDKPGFLVNELAKRPEDVSLVFCRTKHGAERLKRKLEASGFAAGSIHGNKSQNQRDRAIKELREGEIKTLVATDVAARGIDIPGVTHVYNFDLPEVPEAYVHRIGRTARAGADGQAVALCSPEDIGLLRQVERLIGIAIPVASGEVPRADRAASPKRNRGGGGRQGQANGRHADGRQGKGAPRKNTAAGDNDNARRPQRRRNKQNRGRTAA